MVKESKPKAKKGGITSESLCEDDAVRDRKLDGLTSKYEPSPKKNSISAGIIKVSLGEPDCNGGGQNADCAKLKRPEDVHIYGAYAS